MGGRGGPTSRRRNPIGLPLALAQAPSWGRVWRGLVFGVAGSRTRLAGSAHSRLDAEPRQDPRLKDDPKHDDCNWKQDFHDLPRWFELAAGWHRFTSGANAVPPVYSKFYRGYSDDACGRIRTSRALRVGHGSRPPKRLAKMGGREGLGSRVRLSRNPKKRPSGATDGIEKRRDVKRNLVRLSAAMCGRLSLRRHQQRPGPSIGEAQRGHGITLHPRPSARRTGQSGGTGRSQPRPEKRAGDQGPLPTS